MARQQPQRTCISTGVIAPKAELLRFVKGPDNNVWFDVTGKVPGRGAYVVPSIEAVKKAFEKKGLSRKLEAQVPDTLEAVVSQQLTQQALNLLGLAKKAGRASIGLSEVLKSIKARHVKVLVLANDAGKDTCAKIANWQGNKVTFLDKQQLENAFGMANTAVAGLTDGAIWPTLHRAEKFFESLKLVKMAE